MARLARAVIVVGRGGSILGVRIIDLCRPSLGVHLVVRLVVASVIQLFLSRLTTLRPVALTQLACRRTVVCKELSILKVRPCSRHGAPFGVFTFLQLAVMTVQLVLMTDLLRNS